MFLYVSFWCMLLFCGHLWCFVMLIADIVYLWLVGPFIRLASGLLKACQKMPSKIRHWIYQSYTRTWWCSFINWWHNLKNIVMSFNEHGILQKVFVTIHVKCSVSLNIYILCCCFNGQKVHVRKEYINISLNANYELSLHGSCSLWSTL